MKHIKTISKIIVLLLCVSFLITGCSKQSTQNESSSKSKSSVSFTCKEIPVHYFSLENQGTLPVYFADGNMQVPYLDVGTICTLMNSCFDMGVGYEITMEANGSVVTLTRETGYPLIIDFDADTFTFYDYDKFKSYSDSLTVIDILANGSTGGDDQSFLFHCVPEHSYDRYGHEFVIDLSKYNIDLPYDKEKYYIPLQTFADILLNYRYQYFLYNTEELFVVTLSTAYAYLDGESVPIMEQYYSVTGQTRSPELIEYTYNELCMTLDNFYGLKELHDIESFDEYFEQIETNGSNMKDQLCSENSQDMDSALAQLMRRDFDDQHSSFILSSFYSGSDQSFTNEIPYGFSNNNYEETSKMFKSTRKAYYPDGIPGYEEVGSTAYITFDEFNSPKYDLYDENNTQYGNDTISLIVYSHSRITREDSPIENVVIDLSCNGGGSVDAAAFVIAWFLGEASLYLTNPVTGASSCTTYRCDTNLDKEYTDADTVSGYNLYCLTSPLSFSCGNLVPAAFQLSNKVTIIGQTAGGGSCMVLPLSTASGSMFQTSGTNRLSVIKNGAYYDIDKGITPDVILTKIDSFYDREELTDYINSLK